MTLILIWSRRWRRRDAAPPRRRHRGRQRVVPAQVRWAPENPLQNYLALGLANNVKDSASEKTRERVIGVRGPSLWQAALEHPGYDRLPTDDRLLLCCCMNIDEKHPLRRGLSVCY
jgi:hypothetical protein